MEVEVPPSPKVGSESSKTSTHQLRRGKTSPQMLVRRVLPLGALKKHVVTGNDGSQEIVRAEKGLLDRKTSRFMPYWDATMLLALLFAATVTPFEVTYLDAGPCITTLFAVNRFVDLFFIIDIGVTFNLIDEDPETGKMLYKRSQIAQRYLKSWFLIDLISVLPFWVLSWLLAPPEAFVCVPSDVLAIGVSDASSAASAIRMLRLVRMIKLARILKASRVIKRTEAILLTKFEFPRSTLKLFKLLLMLLIVTHWQACLWSAVSLYLSVAPADGVQPRTWIAAFVANERDTFDREVTHGDAYVAAMYWSFMTLTSIGYGDFYPLNTLERALSCMYQLVSGMVWAQVIGTMAAIAHTMNPEGAAFEATMEHLNRYMGDKHLPRALRDELREYFTLARKVHRAANEEALVDGMSPLLQGKVAMFTHGRWLKGVPFLRIMDEASEGDAVFLTTLTARMVLTAYVQTERLPLGRLYIVRKGIACKRWRFYTTGHAWGEDVLLDDAELIDHGQAVAMTFMEMYHLTRDDFLDVADAFPEQIKRVNTYIRLKIKLQRLLLMAVAKETGHPPRSFTPRSASSGFSFASNFAATKDLSSTLSGKLNENAVAPARRESNGQMPGLTRPRRGSVSQAQAPVAAVMGTFDSKLDLVASRIEQQQVQITSILEHLRLHAKPVRTEVVP